MASSWSCPKADWPFGGHDADHLEGHVADADGLVERVAVAEEIARDRAAEQHDDLAAPDLLRIEGAPALDIPLAGGEVVEVDGIDAGAPVGAAGDDLGIAAHERRRRRDALDLARDGGGVLVAQGRRRARPRAGRRPA